MLMAASIAWHTWHTWYTPPWVTTLRNLYDVPSSAQQFPHSGEHGQSDGSPSPQGEHYHVSENNPFPEVAVKLSSWCIYIALTICAHQL